MNAEGSTRRTRPRSALSPPHRSIRAFAPGRMLTASPVSTSTTASSARGSPISSRGVPCCTTPSLSCMTASTRPSTGEATSNRPSGRRPPRRVSSAARASCSSDAATLRPNSALASSSVRRRASSSACSRATAAAAPASTSLRWRSTSRAANP